MIPIKEKWGESFRGTERKNERCFGQRDRYRERRDERHLR